MHRFSFQFKIKFKHQYWILGIYVFQLLATIPKR